MIHLQLEYARGDMLAGKYEVVDRLDEGPLGITYRVRHLERGAYVLLILLDPRVAGREQKDALIAAYKTARSFQHKNLLRVGQLGEHAGVAFVTMEDFEGRTLRELLHTTRDEAAQFSLREAAQIIIQVLEALRAVHDAGATFRALRPEYVIVRDKRTGPKGANVIYEVRVMGAGLWDLVQPGSLAEDEFTRGEAQYLAPELKSVEPQPTPRSDVYSAGVIFYELLVGNAPMGTYQLPRQRRPELPAHVDDVIELALAPAAADRYPTALDFISDIQRTFQGSPEADVEAEQGSSKLLWGLLALLVIAVVALVAQRSSVDPYEQAISADNALKRQVYEAHVRPEPAEIRAILERHPENMMYIPPGPYIAGRLAQEPRDLGGDKASTRELPGYLIDVFEYPNKAGAPPKYGVTYDEAARICSTEGKRLCSAEEFEKACRGPENYVYGYGDTFDEDFCGKGVDDPHNSGAYPECKSSWGVYDIAGNFREWTSTAKGSSANRKIVKGGLPQSAERGTRCAYGTDLSQVFADDTIAFRCCRDVDAEPVPAAE